MITVNHFIPIKNSKVRIILSAFQVDSNEPDTRLISTQKVPLNYFVKMLMPCVSGTVRKGTLLVALGIGSVLLDSNLVTCNKNHKTVHTL